MLSESEEKWKKITSVKNSNNLTKTVEKAIIIL